MKKGYADLSFVVLMTVLDRLGIAPNLHGVFAHSSRLPSVRIKINSDRKRVERRAIDLNVDTEIG